MAPAPVSGSAQCERERCVLFVEKGLFLFGRALQSGELIQIDGLRFQSAEPREALVLQQARRVAEAHQSNKLLRLRRTKLKEEFGDREFGLRVEGRAVAQQIGLQRIGVVVHLMGADGAGGQHLVRVGFVVDGILSEDNPEEFTAAGFLRCSSKLLPPKHFLPIKSTVQIPTRDQNPQGRQMQSSVIFEVSEKAIGGKLTPPLETWADVTSGRSILVIENVIKVIVTVEFLESSEGCQLITETTE